MGPGEIPPTAHPLAGTYFSTINAYSGIATNWPYRLVTLVPLGSPHATTGCAPPSPTTPIMPPKAADRIARRSGCASVP